MSGATTAPGGRTEVSRNASCPCGSGKRYKHCHGAVAELGVESVEVVVRRGLDAHRADRLDAAESSYRAALIAVPAHPLALHYLGVVLYQRQQLGDALPLLARAAALAPHEPEFHNNHGLALADAARLPEAIDAYRRALALQPAHPLAWNNLGLALQLTGSPDAAVDAFRRALGLQPDFAQAHWNLALALLVRGRYTEAWPEYAWRLRAADFATQLRDYPGLRWTGDDPGGRTLLLTAEQGLGDTLQNLRFARELARRGARVVAVVQEPLVRLAATAPGVTSACTIDDLLPAYDAHVSLMSLPGLLEVTSRTIPVPVPYLHAEPTLLAQAHSLLAALPAGPRNVGLAWAGAAANRYNTRRACPLSSLAPLFGVAGVRWFSLQRDGEGIDATDAEQAARLITLDLRNDFDGTAALVDALDLVISVDTSLAHLAGALAKPVWILLPFAPDWRWLLDRDDSPWYPTARLFRQRTAGDWSTPVDAMCETLRREISQA